ncbi:hypothetical protein GCK32_019132, partial [Trichostrongylus colubriformis]
FNGAVGGPDVAPTVTALLTCRADQQWYFTDGTSSLREHLVDGVPAASGPTTSPLAFQEIFRFSAVKDVGCSVIPEEEEGCATCDEAAVTFHMKTLPEEVDVMKE